MPQGFCTYRKESMSHFTSIQTQIKDIDALFSACQEMDLVLLRDGEVRGFGTQKQKAAYVIQLKGPFDIALHPENDATFRLSTDWWEGHVEKEVGKHCGRLLQLYAVHKATKEARKQGLTVLRRATRDGSIKLTIGGASL